MADGKTMIDVESSGRITRNPSANPRIPYPHQMDAMKSLTLVDEELQRYSTLVVIPTGGGKTYTLSNWLLKNAVNKRKKVLWIAHRQMLLDQAAQSFQQYSFEENIPNVSSYTYRVISGSSKHDRTIDIKPNDDLLVVSKDSLARKLERLDKWLENEDEVYLVIDEAHHSTAKTYRKIIQYLRERIPHLKLIGITATPFRTADEEQGLLGKIYYDGVKDGAVIEGDLGIAYEISLKELINKQILSRPRFEFCDTKESFGENLGGSDWEDILNFDKLPEDVADKMAKNAERNKLIVERYVENQDRYGQTLVFALNVIHAIQLNEQFRLAGIKSDFIISNLKDIGTNASIGAEHTDEAISKYKSGELQVLINVNILTEGVDLPQTKTVFLTRPTISRVLMTQMIGRALRGVAAGGTKESYIVSFIDRWNEYIAWVNPETLLEVENDFIDDPIESTQATVRIISIAKIEEFARILDESVDTKELESISFMERIPVGMYVFTYSEQAKEDAEESADRSYQIMVYHSTQEAYESFMDYLPTLFERFGNDDEYLPQDILDAMKADIESEFFSKQMLPPYDSKDIERVLKYYAKESVAPEFYSFGEIDRAKLDVSQIAETIVAKDMRVTEKKNYLDKIWSDSDENLMKTFFVRRQYFNRLVESEIDKIMQPENYGLPAQIAHNQKAIEDLPLYEIGKIDPEYEEYLRDLTFQKATNDSGDYVCAICGTTKSSKRCFQVDHIKPLDAGGKSVPDNLQVLCLSCNANKGSKYDD